MNHPVLIAKASLVRAVLPVFALLGLLAGLAMPLDAAATAAYSPNSVTGTIHYAPVPPALTITAPSAATVIGPQTLAGSLSTAGSVSVNGVNVPLNPDHSFSFPLNLNVGPNSLVVLGVDTSGNRVTLTKSLTLEFTINVGVSAAGESITVTDIATGATVSGIVGAEGTFSTVLPGAAGDNLSIVLTDGSGNSTTPFYLHGDDAPLSLTVTSPSDGASIAGDSIAVTGTYTGPAGTGITVDGVAASLANGQWIADGVPLASGSNNVVVVGTTLGGSVATQTFTVISTGTNLLSLTGTPALTGNAPLNVTFQYQFTGSTTLTNFSINYGDGTSHAQTQWDSSFNHTYNIPGVYLATLTVTDDTDAQFTAVVKVTVQDPNAMDAMFRRMWTDMTTALAHGNKSAAMIDLDSTAQQNYGPVFDALLPNMQQITSSFSPLLGGSLSGTVSEYTVVRVVNGQATVSFVYFVLGIDGIWRLDSM